MSDSLLIQITSELSVRYERESLYLEGEEFRISLDEDRVTKLVDILNGWIMIQP